MDTKVQVSNSVQIAQNQLLAVRVFNYEGRQLKLKTPDFCPYGSNGFDDDCHCNNCIDAIVKTGLPKIIWLYEISNKLKRKKKERGRF